VLLSRSRRPAHKRDSEGPHPPALCEDGSLPENASGGTFPGFGFGCDANSDSGIDAGDISCTVLIIFEGQESCGNP